MLNIIIVLYWTVKEYIFSFKYIKIHFLYYHENLFITMISQNIKYLMQLFDH
jgi:hypothetical protein